MTSPDIIVAGTGADAPSSSLPTIGAPHENGRVAGGKVGMEKQTLKPARWKSAIIAAVALLAAAGLFIVLFNLPIVTGDAPQ